MNAPNSRLSVHIRRRREHRYTQAVARQPAADGRPDDESCAHHRADLPEDLAALLFGGGVGHVTEQRTHAARAQPVDDAAQKEHEQAAADAENDVPDGRSQRGSASAPGGGHTRR